jgi:hypothetical protein
VDVLCSMATCRAVLMKGVNLEQLGLQSFLFDGLRYATYVRRVLQLAAPIEGPGAAAYAGHGPPASTLEAGGRRSTFRAIGVLHG